MQLSGEMGLPLRIALPIFAVIAVLFIAIMGYFVKAGLGDNGTALGYGAPAEQGDARIQAGGAPAAAAAAPVAPVTDPPGTFTVPQTGTGPIAQSPALPGNTVGGGGPPAPVMQELTTMRGRLKANPNDLAALVTLATMYFDAGKFDQSAAYDRRALALDPGNPDVRTDYATALHNTGHDLEALAQLQTVLKQRPKFVQALFNRGVILVAIGRRTDAAAAFKAFVAAAPNDPRVPDVRNTIADLAK
jgi:tetratricopeptide (TPR) repeat protein